MEPIRFTALGFPVRVEPSFFLTIGVALLFELSSGGPIVYAFVWGAVVFVSILVHELGHALMARALSVPTGTITLHALGGQVQTRATTPGKSLAVSLAGPGAGLLLGGLTIVTAALLTRIPGGARIVEDLLWVNIAWSLFNLLPMYPLDGGNALRSALGLVVREPQAWRVTAGIGVLMGALVLVFGFQSGMMLTMYLGGFAIYTNWQILGQLER